MTDRETDTEQKYVFCPECSKMIDIEDPELYVSYSPVGATLVVDGGLTWGDTFLDYSHLSCGTNVRIGAHRGWNSELFEYVLEEHSDIEVYVKGEYIRYGPSEFFSARTDGYPEVWLPTRAVLLELLEGALDLLHNVPRLPGS